MFAVLERSWAAVDHGYAREVTGRSGALTSAWLTKRSSAEAWYVSTMTGRLLVGEASMPDMAAQAHAERLIAFLGYAL